MELGTKIALGCVGMVVGTVGGFVGGWIAGCNRAAKDRLPGGLREYGELTVTERSHGWTPDNALRTRLVLVDGQMRVTVTESIPLAAKI